MTFSQSTTGTYAGAISGSGAVNVSATTIASGATLGLTGTGSIANSSVTANGTFDISGAAGGVSIISLAGANTGVVRWAAIR